MAAKVNTKFISLLAAVIVVAVVGAAAFYALFVRKSNADLMAAGDKHLQLAQAAEQTEQASKDDQDAFAAAREETGTNYRLAAESYGKAFNRDRSDVDVLLKYIAARRKMTVNDGPEATRALREISNLTREATELRRDDDELLDSYYQQLYRWGKSFGAPSFFTELLSLTSSKLETDPDNLVAIKFNCIARSLTLSESMDRDEQAEIRDGLERVLESRPDDTDAMYFLARWHLFDAKRLARAQAEPAAIQAAVDTARAYAQQAFEIAPNDGEVAIEYITVLLDPTVKGVEEAKPVVEGLVAYLSDNPDPPSLVARVTRLLPALERERVDGDNARVQVSVGTARAEALLRRAVELRPGVLMFRLLLAENLKNQLRLDEAHEVFLAARDFQVTGPFEQALRDESLRQQAVYEVANIELIRAEAAPDPDRRLTLLGQADDAIDLLEAVTGESVKVLMLRGKTALLRGQNDKALIAIDKASDLYQDRNLEALLLSARARQSLRQWGAAAERLRQALGMMGGANRGGTAASVRLQLAEMLVRGRDFDQADRELQRVLDLPETGPGGEPLTGEKLIALRNQKTLATTLMARGLAARNQPEAAIELLEALGVSDNAQVARTLVGLYQQTGQTDRAQALLQQEAAANPTNLRLLQQRLALASEAERVTLIAEAETAGVAAGTIAQLRDALAGATPRDPGERVDLAVGADTKPLAVALAKVAAYTRSGDSEEARRYFEQARELDPSDDRVLVMGLDYAIADKDFDQARQLVADAARRNLDLADGHLLRGKLAAAEGDLKQALASFDLGLKQRPVFDEGWRQYADLRLLNNEPEAAATAYRKALDQRPDNLAALLGLARAQDRLGRRDAALDALRSAVAYAPANAAVVEQYMGYEARYGRLERVVAMRESLAESSPSNLNNRLNLAMLMAREDRVDDALEIVDQTEADLGQSRNSVGTRARILAFTDSPDQGAQVITRWLESRGGQAQDADRMMLARYLVSVGRIDDAVAAYQTAAEATADATNLRRELADVLFNNGRPQEALELYAQLLDQVQDDDKQRIGLRLAEAQLRSGQNESAAATLDRLDADATSDALRALLAMNSGNPEDALAMVDRAIEKDPNASTSYLQRAQIRLQTPGGDLNAALDDIDRLLAAQPTNVQGLGLRARVLSALGRSAEAADTLQTLLDAQPGNHNVRASLARALMAAGDPNRAAYLVGEGLKLAPARADFLEINATLAQRRGDTQAAENSLVKLVDAQPENAAAVVQLTETYLASGRSSEAAALLNEKAALVNRFPVMQALRGRALAAGGQTEEARRVFGLALERSGSPEITGQVVRQIAATLGRDGTPALVDELEGRVNVLWAGLGIVNLDLAARDYPKALARVRALKPLAAAEPNLAKRVASVEALCLLQSGQAAEARTAYEAILKTDPDNLEALNNISYLLLTELDDPAAAVPLAERAARQAPRNPDVLDTYGVALMKVGRLEEARVQLENSVDIAPAPSSLLNLGRLYAELGLNARARNRFEDAIQLGTQRGDEKNVRDATRALERIE